MLHKGYPRYKSPVETFSLALKLRELEDKLQTVPIGREVLDSPWNSVSRTFIFSELDIGVGETPSALGDPS